MSIIPYKNREIDYSFPIQVYRNLTKKCWSLRQDRLVVAHADELYLTNFSCVVIEKYRQKVVKTKVKNVHAWICGYLTDECNESYHSIITYNPYYNKYFMRTSIFAPQHKHEIVNKKQDSILWFKNTGKILEYIK